MFLARFEQDAKEQEEKRKGKSCIENMAKFSRVLVAGGADFIGSHTVDKLLNQDIEVIVLDNLYTGRLENIEQCKGNRKFRFVQGDVRSLDLVKRLVKEVDAVFNEAAVVSVSRSLEDPILANEVNVGGTSNLLKACLHSEVKRFVQTSSASVYAPARARENVDSFHDSLSMLFCLYHFRISLTALSE